uniref:Uncharacterized protein n=1 Tax=Romanomermis culicivorax TaxID=13658 RepID=A0A915JRX5_ROMCU
MDANNNLNGNIVAPINLIGKTFFKQIKIYLNGELISDSQLVEHRAWRSQKNNAREKDLLKQVCSFLAFAAVGLTSWTVTSWEIMHINRRKLHNIGANFSPSSLSADNDNKNANSADFLPVIVDGKADLVSIGRFDDAGNDLDIYLICTIAEVAGTKVVGTEIAGAETVSAELAGAQTAAPKRAPPKLELALLIYSLCLCYKTKSNKVPQRRQFAAAILIEITCTSIVNGLRYKLWLIIHPNVLYFLTFIHIHCTITVILVISILSKFYHDRLETVNLRNRSLAGSVSNKAHPSLARLRDRLMNGTVDLAEVPIAEMNPDDIKAGILWPISQGHLYLLFPTERTILRKTTDGNLQPNSIPFRRKRQAELKRVYTQLRMYRLTNLYIDNPHLNKKKGYKKSAHPLALTSSSKRASTTNILRTNKSLKINANSIRELAPEENSLIPDSTIARELEAFDENGRGKARNPHAQQPRPTTPLRSPLVTFKDATKTLPIDQNALKT